MVEKENDKKSLKETLEKIVKKSTGELLSAKQNIAETASKLKDMDARYGLKKFNDSINSPILNNPIIVADRFIREVMKKDPSQDAVELEKTFTEYYSNNNAVKDAIESKTENLLVNIAIAKDTAKNNGPIYYNKKDLRSAYHNKGHPEKKVDKILRRARKNAKRSLIKKLNPNEIDHFKMEIAQHDIEEIFSNYFNKRYNQVMKQIKKEERSADPKHYKKRSIAGAAVLGSAILGALVGYNLYDKNEEYAMNTKIERKKDNTDSKYEKAVVEKVIEEKDIDRPKITKDKHNLIIDIKKEDLYTPNDISELIEDEKIDNSNDVVEDVEVIGDAEIVEYIENPEVVEDKDLEETVKRKERKAVYNNLPDKEERQDPEYKGLTEEQKEFIERLNKREPSEYKVKDKTFRFLANGTNSIVEIPDEKDPKKQIYISLEDKIPEEKGGIIDWDRPELDFLKKHYKPVEIEGWYVVKGTDGFERYVKTPEALAKELNKSRGFVENLTSEGRWNKVRAISKDTLYIKDEDTIVKVDKEGAVEQEDIINNKRPEFRELAGKLDPELNKGEYTSETTGVEKLYRDTDNPLVKIEIDPDQDESTLYFYSDSEGNQLSMSKRIDFFFDPKIEDTSRHKERLPSHYKNPKMIVPLHNLENNDSKEVDTKDFTEKDYQDIDKVVMDHAIELTRTYMAIEKIQKDQASKKDIKRFEESRPDVLESMMKLQYSNNLKLLDYTPCVGPLTKFGKAIYDMKDKPAKLTVFHGIEQGLLSLFSIKVGDHPDAQVPVFGPHEYMRTALIRTAMAAKNIAENKGLTSRMYSTGKAISIEDLTKNTVDPEISMDKGLNKAMSYLRDVALNKKAKGYAKEELERKNIELENKLIIEPWIKNYKKKR